MPDDNVLSGSLQETIITSLIYVTDDNTKIISKLVDLNWFEDPYQEIVEKVLKYWRANNVAPERTHIDDVIDFVLKDSTNRKYNLYHRIIDRLEGLSSG